MSIFEDRPYIQKQDTKPAAKPQGRVSRYRAGKAPQWGENRDESEEEEEVPVEAKPAPTKVEQKTDRRLERLQDRSNVSKEEAIRRRRDREVVAEIVSVAKKEEDEDEEEESSHHRHPPARDAMDDMVAIKTELPDEDQEEDDADARRDRIRQQLLKKKKEEEAAMPITEEEEEEEEESGSEYETDSDYDEFKRPTIQPVFVRKQDRETIEERDKKIQEEIDLIRIQEQQKEERKIESKKLKDELVRREKIELANLAEGEDTDEKIDENEEEEDEAREFDAWKLRELARIKRDKEERESAEKEKEETERRRNMTDQEILLLDAAKFTKEKTQLRFMQKYYHKGAFFHTGDEEEVQNMDFSAPTGEDLIDKESLPKIMQVKNFGRSGRTKYTHLTDQDTTFFLPSAARTPAPRPEDKDKPVYREKPLWGHDDEFQKKLGGLHGGFNRPALKKQRKPDA